MGCVLMNLKRMKKLFAEMICALIAGFAFPSVVYVTSRIVRGTPRRNVVTLQDPLNLSVMLVMQSSLKDCTTVMKNDGFSKNQCIGMNLFFTCIFIETFYGAVLRSTITYKTVQ